MASLIISQAACSSNGQKQNSYQGESKSTFALDTICTITIYGMEKPEGSDGMSDSQVAIEAIDKVFKKIGEYEKLFSKTVEGSDIYRINAAGGDSVKVDEKTIDLISLALKYCELSDGNFDISCGAITEEWNFHEATGTEEDEKYKAEYGALPDSDELAEKTKHVDYKKVTVDSENCTVKLEDPEMKLDLGGIAKGYIADLSAIELESLGVKSAVIDLGGNIVVIGGKAWEFYDTDSENYSDFVLGVKDPLSENGSLLDTISSSDCTLVTSGTYERYFEVDGVKYHHILDPETGWPAETDVEQVTIIGKVGVGAEGADYASEVSRISDSADCDAISTTCLILGMEKGYEFVMGLKEAGYEIDAIFLGTDGNKTSTIE